MLLPMGGQRGAPARSGGSPAKPTATPQARRHGSRVGQRWGGHWQRVLPPLPLSSPISEVLLLRSTQDKFWYQKYAELPVCWGKAARQFALPALTALRNRERGRETSNFSGFPATPLPLFTFSSIFLEQLLILCPAGCRHQGEVRLALKARQKKAIVVAGFSSSRVYFDFHI